ncbi:uncharacterized protein LOC116612107 [Nematostella vectensis]|uniref:uncharacterized protein LOC116612107 n=1 Tax=Nematostella vectensis TaxID=45351 RepID=UPI001390200B|nr:uncharacterized protein LOC116612107 [Nematostella vectensis]
MGCSSGKPRPVGDAVIEVPTPKKNSNERSTSSDRLSLHKKTPVPTARQWTKQQDRSPPSPVERLEITALDPPPKNTQNQRLFSSKLRQPDSRTPRAWTTSRKKSSPDRNGNYDKRISEDVASFDSDSEYGKDGIDFMSTEVQNTGEIHRRASLGHESHLNGILNDSSFPHTVSISRKADVLDETFDPYKLIDVDKFKAANVPAQRKEKQTKNNTTLEIPTQSSEVRGQHKLGVATDSFTDFYDDEEKDLMASIEQDYMLSQNTSLP